MSLTLNIRHLEQRALELAGELSAEELGLVAIDDLIRPAGPVRYALVADRQERGILLQGTLAVDFRCECARCLEEFTLPIRLDAWACLLPWEGEDRVQVRHDSVDLTPYLREDIVLALPQRPLCKPECGGLRTGPEVRSHESTGVRSAGGDSSAWNELDKLRF